MSSRLGRFSALMSTLSLAAIWAWLAWWDYSRLGLLFAGLISVPLLALQFNLWRLRLRTHQLGTLISCLYMALAAMEVFASGGGSGAVLLLVASALWFGSGLLYCRAELRLRQQLSQ